MVTPCRDGNSGEEVIPDTDTGDFIGYVYRFIEDRHEEQEKREETQSGVDMATPCRDGNSGEDVIPDTDTGDFIDSVPNDILQKRVSLVKQYAWIKEEMMKTSAESIADDLYANGRLSRVDCEAICHCSWRRDAVEQLLKKILMGPNDIFDKFLQSLREPEGNIAETLENTDPTPDEVYVFKLLEKSSLKQCPRPDHTDPRFSLTESDCQTLLFYLNDKNTIDVINNSLLSRFFLSIREHTNICVCSMRSEGRVGELLNTMKLCSDKIFSSLSEILADMKMEHVTMKLERKRQTAMKKKRVQEDNTAEDESSTSAAKQLCVDSDIEHRLVTSMQKSASSLRLHTIDQLGFYVWSVNTGSIVIKLYPINRGSWRRLEENCMSGKIKDCISEVYNNDAIQDLLPEGEYRLQFTIYTIPTDQEGGKKALFHLGTEHEAPQQGVPVSDDGHHDSPIEDYMDLLCEELEISTTLLTLLKEENIVEYNIKEDIDKQGSRSKKIKYLLNQVDRHGNRGYAVLKQHIKEANEDLHKELMTREGVKNMDAQLDTSANVTTLSKATVGHRGPYSKEVFFSGTAILKVEKNVEPTKKEDIDPDTEKRKLEISCPEIINSVCHFTSKSDSNSSTGSDSQVTASKVGESATSIIDVAATAIRYPLGIFDRKIREVRLDILKEQNQPHYKKPNILLLGKSGSGKSTLINNVFQAICGNKYQNAKPGPGMAQSKTLQLTFYENCGVLLEDILREEDELMIRRLIPNLPNMVEGAAVGNADTPELRELLTLLLEGRIGPGTNIRELEKDQLKYGVGYLKRTAATPREELRIHKIVYVQNCWDAAAVDLIKSIKAVTSAPEPKVTDNIFAVINMYAVPMLPGQTRDESRFVRDYYEDFFADVAKQLSIEGSVVFDMLDWRFYKRWRFDNAHLRTLEFLQKLILPGTPEPPPIPPETLD